LDIDVNQFYYDETYEIQSKVKYMMKDTRQLKNQIWRGEFKMFCRSDPFVDLKKNNITQPCLSRLDPDNLERKMKMEERGMKCINKTCDNPYCIFATEETFAKELNKIELYYFRMELIDISREIKKKDDVLGKLNEDPITGKELNGGNFVKRRLSKKKEDSKRDMKKKNKRKQLLSKYQVSK
jgi:hypothetical protein